MVPFDFFVPYSAGFGTKDRRIVERPSWSVLNVDFGRIWSNSVAFSKLYLILPSLVGPYLSILVGFTIFDHSLTFQFWTDKIFKRY